MAPEDSTNFGSGDWAVIGDDDESRVIVVDTPDVTAGDYMVPGTGRTVAEYNDCDDEPVIITAFVESLNNKWEAWSVDKVLEAYDDGELHERVRSYAYPESRLELLHAAERGDHSPTDPHP